MNMFFGKFSPLISEVCNDLHVKYVSWVYDCPLHIRNKEPMKYSCNMIFFLTGLRQKIIEIKV